MLKPKIAASAEPRCGVKHQPHSDEKKEKCNHGEVVLLSAW